MHEQRTEEWFAERLGHITASKFGAVMTKPKSKSDLISQTAHSYMVSLLSEMMTGLHSDFSTESMEWGTNNEAEAREEYEFRTLTEVVETGFIKHSSLSFVGGSPDGLVGEKGIIEIKCQKTDNHIEYLLNGEIPKSYIAQIQGNLWITGREWCDFISYDPRILDSSKRMMIRKIARDDSYIAQLESAVMGFRKVYLALLKEFGFNY